MVKIKEIFWALADKPSKETLEKRLEIADPASCGLLTVVNAVNTAMNKEKGYDVPKIVIKECVDSIKGVGLADMYYLLSIYGSAKKASSENGAEYLCDLFKKCMDELKLEGTWRQYVAMGSLIESTRRNFICNDKRADMPAIPDENGYIRFSDSEAGELYTGFPFIDLYELFVCMFMSGHMEMFLTSKADYVGIMMFDGVKRGIPTKISSYVDGIIGGYVAAHADDMRRKNDAIICNKLDAIEKEAKENGSISRAWLLERIFNSQREELDDNMMNTAMLYVLSQSVDEFLSDKDRSDEKK